MTPHDLLANFEILAEAPNGIQCLRKLVLELAVRGKLVEQDGKDEPIHEALNRILGQQKAQQRPEGVFDLPGSWAWVSGEDTFEFITSGSRGWAQYYASDGPIFLRIGNLDYDTTALDLRDIQRVNPPSGAEGQRTATRSGDVLVSITGDTGMIGLVPDGFDTAYINQHIALCRPTVTTWAPYIATVLLAPFAQDQFRAGERGIKKSLGLGDIRGLRLPIPPEAEQRRIVARVDELMDLLDRLKAKRQEREAARTATRDSAIDALREAPTADDFETAWLRIQDRFHELFATPEDVEPLRALVYELAVCGRLVEPNPEQWASCRLDETGEWAIGAGFPTALQGRSDQEYGFCKVSDMNLPGNDRYITRTNHTVSAHDLQILRAKAHPPGTVIFPKIGGAIATNKRRLLARPTAIDNNCLGITPRREVLAEWLFLILKSINLSKYQSGTSVPALAQGVIGAIRVKVPSIQAQQETLHRVDELMSLLSRLSQVLTNNWDFASGFAAAAVHHVET